MKNSEKLQKQSIEISKVIQKNIKEFNFVGTDVIDAIYRRTKRGKGIESGEEKPLKPLNERYIKRRASLDLDTTTKPKKSNLTLTGKMLSDMFFKVTGTTFIFSFNETFSKQKAIWNQEKGRTFFGLTNREETSLKRKIASKIRELIRKSFTG